MSKISLNYVNFLRESPLNSLDLDLKKPIEPCNSSLAKVSESQGTWVPKRWVETLKKVSQFGRIGSRKIFFAKSKLTNLKNTRGGAVGGGAVQKSIYIQTPSFWNFSGIAHTQARKQGVPYIYSTRISRSGLPSFIKSRSTLQSLVRKIYKLSDTAYLVNFKN